ncbi:unnamed protein product [Clonostachys solani]|uniref:GPI ethanolamine phosphate transferase 1 n=1 Tax=Clonostachys solani TaxID=160281 RepID=A0A9P0EJJ6_9HYPO|nr:unnamed protein product [Clonostachys solani]
MPPRTKASFGLTSLIESDSEPDLDSLEFHDAQPAQEPMSPAPAPKRATRGRPPANRVTKPAQRLKQQSVVTSLTTRKALEEKSSNTSRVSKTSKKQDQSIASNQVPEKPAPARRGRPKRSSANDSQQPTEPPVKAKAIKTSGRRTGSKGIQIQEETSGTQQIGAEDIEMHNEIQADESIQHPDEPSAEESIGSQVDDLDKIDSASMGRRLEELSKRYANLEARHRDLRDVAIRDAERNFERLKTQAEQSNESAKKLIEQLKAELATQTILAKQGKAAQHKLDLSEAKCDTLRTTIGDLNTSLDEARLEIKTLNTKLAAARNAEAVSRVPPGSALKSTTAACRQASSEAVHAAQAKEDLYTDLTGLIVRGFKKEEEEDVFDCIQTGRNGTLHFKLAVDRIDSVDNFDDVKYKYRPQLDSNRDGELMDRLPSYLVDDLAFTRLQASNFYAVIVKALTERLDFLAIAIVFHLVYLLSIFDVYFVSPIVSGMRLHKVERAPSTKAPADRLVLFVGDGLRADKAFQSFPEPYPKTDDDLVPRPLAPFLRSRILEHGTFGISHTRVPTESRPGHVALIAGLYEDVSAVATGWKLNPVNFDSVFNRSRHTWSWGSPDILSMFEKGAVPGRVDAYMYPPEMEDFSQGALELDYWVFDHVRDFFSEAAKNQTLNRALREDKVVFFLHLLGLDTNGHSYRPYSAEYLHNLQVVDQGVKEITQIIENFYADDRTAFVFTADHGMSDWGSHGDGHPDNTRTPLIAWGSGVAKPHLYPDSVAPGHDEYSSDWNMNHVRRHDVAQADVAALMAYLVGTEFPANSVGELPLSFLAANDREKAEAVLVNAQCIIEQYKVKEENKRATELRFRPYKTFSEEGRTIEERLIGIRSLIEAGKYEEAIEETDSLITITLQGLRYLQTYDWLFLRGIVTIGYLGWMAYAITIVINLFVLEQSIQPQRNWTGTIVSTSILAALYASFVISKSPLTYYAYAFFPVFFWEEVYARRASLSLGRKQLFGHIESFGAWLTLIVHSILYVVVIESLALAYIHREIFTGLYMIGALWPVFQGFSFLKSHAMLSLTWVVSCSVMSVFTLLPANKLEDVNQILSGGSLMVLVGLFYLSMEDYVLADFSWTRKATQAKQNSLIGRTLVGIQIGLIILSMLVTRSSVLSLQAKNGLPLGNQITGWIVLVTSFLIPLAYRLEPTSNYIHRLAVIFLTCAPTFVILAISWEGLFYVAFSLTLFTWLRLEYSLQSFSLTRHTQNGHAKPNGKAPPPLFRPLQLSDARIGLFFLVLLQSAFFSTGNVASVSTFSLESVTRLIPVFDPFSQGALLIVKILIPFALISANLGILNKRLGVAPSALFMLAMALSDILTLYFFWVVKDEGSWLEIGSTISHFAIASLMCSFVAALEGVSAMFIAGVTIHDTPAPKSS